MAKTILMIHGVGSSADTFTRLGAAFREKGWRVEAPTLRDELRPHENPPAELNKVTLADYVNDAAEIARRLTKEDGAAPLLMGHSTGGMIVQKLAEKGLGAGAILITPASPAGARAGRALSQAVTFANMLFTGKPEARPQRIWKTGFTWGVLNLVPKSKHEALWKQNRYDSGRVLADLAYPEEDPNRTCFVDEAKIKVPMLVIGGAKDRTTPIADVRLCAEKYKKVGADYREYANNAHWIVDEPGTDRVIADIFSWLDTKGLSGASAKAAPKKKVKAKAATKPKAAPAPAAKAAKAPPKAKGKPAPKKKAPAKPKAAPAKAKAPPKAAPAKPAKAKPKAKPASKAKARKR